MNSSHKFIDKEYLYSNLENFTKDILYKKFSKKETGDNNTKTLNTLLGDLEGKSIEEILSSFGHIYKVYLDSVSDLPAPAEAKENTLYIVKDTNAIDEKSGYYVYILKEDSEAPKYICISAPSAVFETEAIDFSNRNFINKYNFYKENILYCFKSISEIKASLAGSYKSFRYIDFDNVLSTTTDKNSTTSGSGYIKYENSYIYIKDKNGTTEYPESDPSGTLLPIIQTILNPLGEIEDE